MTDKLKGFNALPADRKQFVIELDVLMNKAGRLKLFATMHKLHDAKRMLGWELAGNVLGYDKEAL